MIERFPSVHVHAARQAAPHPTNPPLRRRLRDAWRRATERLATGWVPADPFHARGRCC